MKTEKNKKEILRENQMHLNNSSYFKASAKTTIFDVDFKYKIPIST